MKRHTVEGCKMLSAVSHPFFERAALVALRHHERWDGSGYPGGLRGEECPREARIVAVADVYDALGQARCYKAAWTDEQIREYFQQNSGKLFEAALVDALFDSLPQLRNIASELPDSATLPAAVAVMPP
jgi:response regulator RpfG family c-di-GMP phosphodiesterase